MFILVINGRFSKAAGIIDMGVARLATTSIAPPHTGKVIQSALIIGSGLSALTVALALADGNRRVILVEKSSSLGNSVPDLEERTRQMLMEKNQAALINPMIDTLFNAHISSVSGHPGNYEVCIQQGDQLSNYSIGAIIVGNGAQPKTLDASRWFDRTRVKTQVEFEQELEKATEPGKMLEVKDISWSFVLNRSSANNAHASAVTSASGRQSVSNNSCPTRISPYCSVNCTWGASVLLTRLSLWKPRSWG